MTDDDLEPRLRTVLAGRAERVDSTLSGPDLRARAAVVKRPIIRFAAPALAAAAVLVVAIATQTLGHDGSHAPRREPPGRVVITTPTNPATPSPIVAPSSTPAHPVRTHRPTPTRPAPTRTTSSFVPPPPRTAAVTPSRAPTSRRSAATTSPPRPSISASHSSSR